MAFYGVDSSYAQALSRVLTAGTGTPQGTLAATFAFTAPAITATAYTLVTEYDSTATFPVTSTQAAPAGGHSSYDVTYNVKCVNAGCTLARLKFNGETVGLINADDTTVRIACRCLRRVCRAWEVHVLLQLSDILVRRFSVFLAGGDSDHCPSAASISGPRRPGRCRCF